MDKITKRKASEAEDIDSNVENIKDIDSTNNKKTKKNKQNKQSKKEKVVKPEEKFCSLYVEAESDDEYAKENFMFPTNNNENDSDDERRHKRNKKLMKKHKKNNIESSSPSPSDEVAQTNNNIITLDSDDKDDDKGEMKPTIDTSSADDEDHSDDEEEDEDEDEDEDGDIEYRIQYILDARSLPASEWRAICLILDTREVTRGSVLKQPDHEFHDTSPQLIEKFLIKWVHASFIHLSWETEKDLLDLCGVTAKGTTLYIYMYTLYICMLF